MSDEQEMWEGNVLLPFVSERAEKPKPGVLYAIVRIDCEFSDNVQLPDSHLIPHGISFVRVPESLIPHIKSMVEPRKDMIAAAEEAYKNALDERIKAATQGVRPFEREAIEAEIRDKFPGSVSGYFANMMKRDLKPFASVDVVQRGILAQIDKAQIDAEAAMARRLQGAMSEQPTFTLEQVEELVERRIAKYEAERAKQAVQAKPAKG